MNRQVAVAIIGAGPAGLAALAEVRKTTADCVVIDCAGGGRIGGRASGPAGRAGGRSPGSGPGGLLESALTGIDRGRAAGLPADLLIQGEARFIGPNTLRAGGQTIRAGAIVIATGAASDRPPYWQELLGDRLLTVETLLAQERLPGSVAVIGLGPAGVEVGQVLHRLGVQVIGIEARQTIARLQDPVVNQLAVERLGREFPLWLGAPALVEPQGDQVLVRAGRHQALVDRVLVAVGRHPALAGLNLAQTGCALDDRGLPLHHPQHLRLGRLPIYIAGDATGGVGGLARTAEQGRVAGYNACHRTPIELGTETPMTLVCSEPNIAWVGPAWSALDQSVLMTGQMGVAALDADLCLSQGRHRSLLRVYADCRNGRVLGGAMIGPDCERLASALAGGLERQLTVHQLVDMPVADPAAAAVLREIGHELSCRIRPIDVNPPARRRLMTWPGRAVTAAMLSPWIRSSG